MQIDEIVNRVFSRSFMGYDMREVDCFLDDIIDQLERYESERKEMLTAMEYLLDKLEHGGTLPEVRKTLSEGEQPQRRKRSSRNVHTVSSGSQGKEKRVSGDSVRQATDAAVAIEVELLSDAPDENMADLLPDLLSELTAETEAQTERTTEERSAGKKV